ncbi:MAG: DNA repair protein RadC [Erysipelotrichaceae bacterium]|nr:DNA repair protein RadC [Erysipelotrichaceae bacterium]
MILKEIPKSERPREKALKFGITALSNRELIAILIKTGFQGYSSLKIAEDVLKISNGIGNLSKLELRDFLKVKGIKEAKALEILACIELSKRLNYEECLDLNIIDRPKALITWLNKEIGSSQQEQFMVVYLNTKNRIITYRILFKGTIDSSLIHPREIFKEALLLSSSKILLVHNHPSGDTTPSDADIKSTYKIIEAGNLMGIKVIDHIIVTCNKHFSFVNEGII